jgi:hypothetical protein
LCLWCFPTMSRSSFTENWEFWISGLLAAVLAVGTIWWQRKTKILDWDLTADEPIVGAAAAQETMSRLKVQYEGVSLRYPRLIRPSATAATALSPPPIGSRAPAGNRPARRGHRVGGSGAVLLCRHPARAPSDDA